MQEASNKIKGSMAAVLGLDYAKVRELCDKASGAGYLTAANINSPGQIVVSGDAAAIRRRRSDSKRTGRKKVHKAGGCRGFPFKAYAERRGRLKGGNRLIRYKRRSNAGHIEFSGKRGKERGWI